MSRTGNKEAKAEGKRFNMFSSDDCNVVQPKRVRLRHFVFGK